MNFAQNQPLANPVTGIWQKTALAALGAIAMLMTGTGAIAQSAKSPKNNSIAIIAGIYNYSAHSIEITASTGCRSSKFRYLDNNVEFQVDEERALITGTGRFNYKPSKYRIVSADCHGAAKQTIKLSNVEARRYSVVINGENRGVLDFTQSAKPPRLTTRRGAGKSGFLTEMQIRHTYASVNLDNWPSRNAASVMDLFRPITKSHPESLEGRPEMELSMRGGPNSITVKITSYGYLDNSVAGGKRLGVVTKTADGWYLESLWQQNLCSRGRKAGQWSTGSCS